MSVANILIFVGGLALFLYGVIVMGDGMKLLTGSRLGELIQKLTGSPVKALGLGAGMSAVIQSSSAVSIMSMGFVSTGLIRLRSALYIVLGSLLGTSITGWIVVLSSGGSGWADVLSTSVIVGIIAFIGILLRKFSKSSSNHVIGDILLGCAVLMMGMSIMTNSMDPFKNNPAFLNFMTKLSNPLLGIIIGIAFTCLVQSSAAGVATLQALALTGSLTFSVAIPVILGITIGGALPVLISSIGVSVNGKRTALSHLIFDAAGVCFIGIIFYIITAIHPFAFLQESIPIALVAFINTLLRLIMIIVLFPFVKTAEKIVCRLIRDKKADESSAGDLEMLEERFLSHTAVAIAQSRRVMDSMAMLVRKNMADADAVVESFSDELFKEVAETEDKYEDKLGTYLIKISSKQLSTDQNEELYTFLHAITDLERISDHALNLSENAKEIHDKNVVFSDSARHELAVLKSAVNEIVEITTDAFVNQDMEKACRVEPLEEHIDNLCNALKHSHIDRLQNETCTLEHGFVFNDLLTNYERIGDHCSNIAVAMLEIKKDVFDTHEYLESLVNMKDEKFYRYFEEYQQKYQL